VPAFGQKTEETHGNSVRVAGLAGLAADHAIGGVHADIVNAVRRQVLGERAAETPTIPSTMGEELLSNLFVRSRDVEEFTHYRHSKDHWRG
jgi:hypothetical protein